VLFGLAGCGRIGFQSHLTAGDGGVVVDGIFVEAEAGELVAPFSVRDDPAALGGRFVMDDFHTSGLTSPGSARYLFDLDAAGTYYVFGRTMGASTDVDSFMVAVDGGERFQYHTTVGAPVTRWTWKVLDEFVGGPPRAFALEAGAHELVVTSRESWSVLDAIVVTDDPAAALP
jgi:hypothetical protein